MLTCPICNSNNILITLSGAYTFSEGRGFEKIPPEEDHINEYHCDDCNWRSEVADVYKDKINTIDILA